MFDRILIANRGEIACRVQATARRLGIATVAVYSDVDAGARHVRGADEAVHIGAAPAAESYLLGSRIIEAALATGAQAIHPGYGFLSESPEFAEAVVQAGLVFIGPPPAAIRSMGLKDAAKRLMESAGVPVVPGYHGEDQDPGALAAQAEAIGYPVLIKARAGGGGKGMRRVESAAGFGEALAAARREAQASFGDPHCLVEKYVARPRHIEIQVLADTHGNVVHLFERECSLQRRHQKVIEEAPAPGMPAPVREAMGRAAVEAARAIGYTGAGTVEFIADGSRGLRDDGFWFMEMNTRLQVEHPVTEAITDLDLVELQLQVAAGAVLPFAKAPPGITGHAIEARIYAEDVERGFLPATGHLSHLHFPPAREFERASLRLDAGVEEGDVITPHYDPMIAKLVAHGPDRPSALARLRRALQVVRIAGAITNTHFLAALCDHPAVRSGDLDTGLIERELAGLLPPRGVDPVAAAAAAVTALGLGRDDGGDPWAQASGFRHWGVGVSHVALLCDEVRLQCRVEVLASGRLRVMADANDVEVWWGEDDELRISDGARVRRVHAAATGDHVDVFSPERVHRFMIPDPLVVAAEGEGECDSIVAPMSGVLKLVSVAPGDAVTRGQSLLVMEAMKMEHTLVSPRDGVVESVLAGEAEQVSEGDLLLRLAPEC